MKKHNWQYADTFGIDLDPRGYFEIKVGFDIDWEELETGAVTRVTGAEVLGIEEGLYEDHEYRDLIAHFNTRLAELHDQMIEAAIEIDVMNDERKEETRYDFV